MKSKSIMTFKNAVTALMALTLSQVALADDIYLDLPVYGGNGCPQGTASAVLSPDYKTLSILFDQYIVEAGGNTGKRMDRKSCNIAIPVHVPQGFSVSILDIDYRGYVDLPRGAEARFMAEYFFAGSRGPVLSKTFDARYGKLTQDYSLLDKLAVTGLVWSRCGTDVNFRINSSLNVKTNYSGHESMATVDSTDIKAGMIYHLQWKRCN